MTVEIVIPQRDLAEAKSRLSPVLDAQQRAALAWQMLARTLAVSLEVARVTVVTPSSELGALVSALGARFVRQEGYGLNGALDDARRDALSRGIDLLAIVNADLPLLTVSDLATMIGAAERTRGGLSIAPDRAVVGTNAMVLRATNPMRFRFGSGSFRAHQVEAAKVAASVQIVQRRGLAIDLDTPADLAAIFGSTGEFRPQFVPQRTTG